MGPNEKLKTFPDYVKNLKTKFDGINLISDDLYSKIEKAKDYTEVYIEDAIKATKEKLIVDIKNEIKKSSKF